MISAQVAKAASITSRWDKNMITYGFYSGDLSCIKCIWDEIFADPEEFTGYYFDVICKKNIILVAWNEDEIVGMVHLNPYDVLYEGRKEKSYYIVGVCVKEKYRFHGIMREMMKYVMEFMKNEGIKFTFLMPKDEAYYVGLGFENIYSNIEVKYNKLVLKEDLKKENLSFENISKYSDENLSSMSSELNRILGEKFSYYSKRDIKYLREFIMEHECQSGGVMAIYNQDMLTGYFSYDIYVQQDKKDMYVERFCTNDTDVENVLEHIKEFAIGNECDTLCVTIPNDTIKPSNNLKEKLIEIEGKNIKIYKGKGIMAYSFIEGQDVGFMKNKSFFDEIV